MTKLKNKLTLLTLIPVCLLVVTLMTTVWLELKSAAGQQIENTRDSLMQLKRAELKNYMELSLSSVTDLIRSNPNPDEVLKRQLQKHIQSLSYDGENYLFAYTSKGERIALGASQAGIGDNFWQVKDPNGKLVVQGLVQVAREKDGFYLYHWPRREGGEPLPKLSFTIWLPNLGWMVGTGFYIDDIEREIAAIEAQTASTMRNALWVSLLISILVTSLMVFLLRIAAKRVMHPLEEMNNNLLEISKGQGDLTKRLPAKTNDEVGQLAGSFNQFVEKIHSIVEQVLACSSEVRSSAAAIEQRNSEVHKLLRQQNTETDMVASAIHEMAASASEIAGSAEHVSNKADAADAKSQQAKIEVKEAIGQVQALAREVSTGANAINTLEQNVQEIASVLDVIRGIAEQTNLLALNAAIEAARAGEQGRGFAVVADEVRTLASRTQESTKEIQQTIERLQDAAKQAVNIMGNSEGNAKVAVSRVDAAGASLQLITAAVGDISAMIAQIAAASEQQQQVSDDINQRIASIADSSTETERLSDLSEADSHKLVSLAGQLQSQVTQFSV